MTQRSQLPPGPRYPVALQTVGWWARPVAFMERRASPVREAVHDPPAGGPAVRDPHRAGSAEGAVRRSARRPAPRRGRRHPRAGRRQEVGDPPRRGGASGAAQADAPAFHGEKMQRLSGLMADVAEREIAGWPRDQAIPLHPLFQGLTLEIILRAVFGLDPGRRLDELRELLDGDPRIRHRARVAPSPPAAARLFGRGPWAASRGCASGPTQLLYELIDERRDGDEERDDMPGHAAVRPPRGRLADAHAGAPRRADDAARRRPRDDRVRARVGVRAAGPRAARCSAAS